MARRIGAAAASGVCPGDVADGPAPAVAAVPDGADARAALEGTAGAEVAAAERRCRDGGGGRARRGTRRPGGRNRDGGRSAAHRCVRAHRGRGGAGRRECGQTGSPTHSGRREALDRHGGTDLAVVAVPAVAVAEPAHACQPEPGRTAAAPARGEHDRRCACRGALDGRGSGRRGDARLAAARLPRHGCRGVTQGGGGRIAARARVGVSRRCRRSRDGRCSRRGRRPRRRVLARRRRGWRRRRAAPGRSAGSRRSRRRWPERSPAASPTRASSLPPGRARCVAARRQESPRSAQSRPQVPGASRPAPSWSRRSSPRCGARPATHRVRPSAR